MAFLVSERPVTIWRRFTLHSRLPIWRALSAGAIDRMHQSHVLHTLIGEQSLTSTNARNGSGEDREHGLEEHIVEGEGCLFVKKNKGID